MNDGVESSVENINKIQEKLTEIMKLNRDELISTKIQSLLKFINDEILNATSRANLEDLIYEKMTEVKHSDKDMNAKLYILYKNVQNNRISREKAEEIFEVYLRESKMDMI